MSAPQGLCERTVSGEYWGEGSGRRGFGAWKRDSLVAPAPHSAEVFPSTTASDLRIAQQNPFTESRTAREPQAQRVATPWLGTGSSIFLFCALSSSPCPDGVTLRFCLSTCLWCSRGSAPGRGQLGRAVRELSLRALFA